MYKEQAIENALNYAKVKNAIGLLLKTDDPDLDNKMTKGSELGDYETIYSITSLYSDDANADESWSDDIEEALCEAYPDFV